MPVPTSYPLDDTFEATGRWWLPDAPEQTLPGTLSFSPDDICLSLHGAFHEPSLQELGVVRNDFERIPVVHGMAEGGRKFTLLNVIVTERNHNLRETTSSKCSAIYLLVGTHTDSFDKLTIRSLSFGCACLEQFLNDLRFSMTERRASGEFDGLEVEFARPPAQSFRCDPISTTFAFDSDLLVSDARTSLTLRAFSLVSVRPDEPQSLDWYMKTIWSYCYLLTLLTDEQVRPTWIQMSLNSDGPDDWLLYRTAGSRRKKEEPSSLLLFYFAHIQDGFKAVLERWFSSSDAMRSAIHLFIDARNGRGESLQGRFLNSTQSLEAFSRATSASSYMLEADYSQVVSVLNSAIPVSLGSDHRTSLKNRIKYGNEHSFRKRVTNLLASLSADGTECVCKSPDQFVGGIVETRNFLTHYTDELRPKALTGVPLSWACERLVMLLRILLLKHVGIDESLVIQRLKQHPRLMQYMWLYKSFPESVA